MRKLVFPGLGRGRAAAVLRLGDARPLVLLGKPAARRDGHAVSPRIVSRPALVLPMTGGSGRDRHAGLRHAVFEDWRWCRISCG